MPAIDRNLAFLFLLNTIVAVYWNMMTTLIPLYIRSLNASVFQVSLVLFIGGLASTATMLPSGILSDRYGRKTLIILSILCLLLSPILYINARSWQETIAYNILASVAFSMFIPARTAMIADHVKPASLATAFGLMNLAWPIGGIAGPLIGGVIADNYGWSGFFYVLPVIVALALVLSLFLGKTEAVEDATMKEEGSLTRSIVLTLTVFLLLHILGNTARGIMGTIFPFYLTEIFHKSKTEVGVFFSAGFGLATLIAQIPSGLLADKVGRKKAMLYSIFPIPFFSFLFSLSDDYVIMLLIYMAISSLWSATWPASSAYLIDLSSASKKGFMMGARLTAVRLGFTIGPFIGGFIWDTFDIAASFYMVTAIFVGSLVFAFLLKE